jgi:hypothetical protein
MVKPKRATRGWPRVVVGVLETSIERLVRFPPAAKRVRREPMEWEA